MKSTNKPTASKLEITYLPTDEISAREFLAWKYEAPYEIYNYSSEYLEQDLAYLLAPANNIHSIYQDDKLIGYCSFGRDAQVPGGDYSEDAIDIGLMIKPEFTGQGHGTSFVANIIQHTQEQYNPKKLRVTILETNQRAMRVWEKNELKRTQTFERERDQIRFVIMTKEV